MNHLLDPLMTRTVSGAAFIAVLTLSVGAVFAQDPVAPAQEAPVAAPPAVPAAAVPTVTPDSTDPTAIMKAVEGRLQADRTKARTVLRITDSGGRVRERVVRSWGMEFDGGKRQLMIFESPADVRNTGLLSVDYEDGNKDDDQWLYLPSLKKSTRISSGDKSGSFMGTDLSYADMTSADPAHYQYGILKQSVSVGGEDCWLIEAKPTTQKARDETGYVKTQLWVSKSKLVTLQVKAWGREGRRLKYIKFGDIKQLDGRWTPHKISARTVRGRTVESTTVIQFTEMSSGNADVTAALFDQRRLEQGL